MRGERLVPIVLVACSVFVLGTMAASLDATVTSSPRDGFDVDTDSLPFVGDGVSEVVVSYEEGSDGQETGAVESRDGAGEVAGAEADVDGNVAGSSAKGSSNADAVGGDSSSGSGADGGQQGDSGDANQGAGSGAGDEDGGTDSSRSLLERLLFAALVVLAILAIVAGASYAYRRRDRLVALLWALARRYGLVSATDVSPATVAEDGGAAATVVERAWGEMLRRSGARCAASDTPRECATAVIATGVDREPVEELTALYERVRYGQRAVTPEHASRALGLLREVPPRHEGPPRALGATGHGHGSDPPVAERGSA